MKTRKLQHWMIAVVLMSATAGLTAGVDSTVETLSNSRLEIRVNPRQGTFDVVDTVRKEPLIKGAHVSFSTAPYVELNTLSDSAVETEVPLRQASAQGRVHRVVKSAAETLYPGGQSLSLFTQEKGHGELEVRFTLYPDRSLVDIGFAFRNLSDKPLRLRQVDVLKDATIMPAANPKKLQLLNGDSGSRNNIVVGNGRHNAENNLLFYFAEKGRPRSLVLGGLTYAEFRKHVRCDPQGTSMFALDPVGRRIDPGQSYRAKDRFVIDASSDNPFLALEDYARVCKQAQQINLHYYTFPSICMWFISVQHFGGDRGSTNNTVGAVREMENIVKSGFLNYSPVAVRLVPDCYEPNNQQGWWDDKHWQMYGRKERCIVDHHYEAPYETTEKWCRAIKDLGGIPFTYFQPSSRSEDYAETFPGHMLYNQAHKYILKDGKRTLYPHGEMGGVYKKMFQENYDYTDPKFITHLREVYANVNKGGVQGIFFDYPERVFPERGGLEDRYATALAAYRNVFRIAREGMGPDAYLQERMGIGSDATLDQVSSVRTAGDNNELRTDYIRNVALRWYKNRLLTNYDMDGKALLVAGVGRHTKLTRDQRRAVLTVSYALTGRLLLTESFRLFDADVLHDLSRVFPFHATPLTARPLDAFLRNIPTIYDFTISDDWHQLVIYNYGNKECQRSVPFSGDAADSALSLDPAAEYHVYDFWNDHFVGTFKGPDSLKQTLRPSEARMLSIRKVQPNPQVLSTNRHIMQGYCELSGVKWENGRLSGKAKVVAGDPFELTVALNGRQPVEPNLKLSADGKLAVLTLFRPANETVEWSINFK